MVIIVPNVKNYIARPMYIMIWVWMENFIVLNVIGSSNEANKNFYLNLRNVKEILFPMASPLAPIIFGKE